MRTLIVLLLLITSTVAAEYNGPWQSGSTFIDIDADGTVAFQQGTLKAAGTWAKETEGKFAGTLKLSLGAKGTRFTLYLQPHGKTLLGVNTVTVLGVYIADMMPALATSFTAEIWGGSSPAIIRSTVR